MLRVGRRLRGGREGGVTGSMAEAHCALLPALMKTGLVMVPRLLGVFAGAAIERGEDHAREAQDLTCT